MGGEPNGLQANQDKQRSKSIYKTQTSEMEKRVGTIDTARTVNTEEKSYAKETVFEIKGEPVEKVDLLKKEPSTQNESHEESEAHRWSAASMPDFQLDQRRKSILQGSPLPPEEKKKSTNDNEQMQKMINSRTVDDKTLLKQSNEKLRQLTDKLLGDRRSASDSFERVRRVMSTLTTLSIIAENPEDVQLDDQFAEQYEHAYQEAVYAVEQYLQSHASWRKTYKGWQRKKWMKQLQETLLGHVDFATDIVSRYTKTEQFQDAVEAESEQSKEQSVATQLENEIPSNVQVGQQNKSNMTQQQELTPIEELEQYCIELSEQKNPTTKQKHLLKLMLNFMELEDREPQNRVRRINLFWTINNMFLAQNNGKLCGVMDRLRVDMGMSQEEINAQQNLPSLDKNVEFVGNFTRIPETAHWVGNSESLETCQIAYPEQLNEQGKRYLQNRIHAAKRMEALEANKTNVTPPPCTVYLNGKEQDPALIDKKNMDQYKFILEDVHQANFQTHGNSCWSAATENLFRQRGVFIHQADIRSYRDSEMYDGWIEALKGDNTHEIHGIRHLVGKVMKNTMLRSRQFRGVEDENQYFSKVRQNKLKLQLKNTIREAIIGEHSAIAICFGIHYRTIVGIEGDKVYYKDSLRSHSAYPDETHETTIDAIIDEARVKREFAGKDKGKNVYTFPIELFWMKDIPAGTDIAKEYQGKIDKTMSVKKDNQGRLYLSHENPDKIEKDQTTVCIQPESRLQGENQPAVVNRDYVPRVIS